MTTNKSEIEGGIKEGFIPGSSFNRRMQRVADRDVVIRGNFFEGICSRGIGKSSPHLECGLDEIRHIEMR